MWASCGFQEGHWWHWGQRWQWWQWWQVRHWWKWWQVRHWRQWSYWGKPVRWRTGWRYLSRRCRCYLSRRSRCYLSRRIRCYLSRRCWCYRSRHRIRWLWTKWHRLSRLSEQRVHSIHFHVKHPKHKFETLSRTSRNPTWALPWAWNLGITATQIWCPIKFHSIVSKPIGSLLPWHCHLAITVTTCHLYFNSCNPT